MTDKLAIDDVVLALGLASNAIERMSKIQEEQTNLIGELAGRVVRLEQFLHLKDGGHNATIQ